MNNTNYIIAGCLLAVLSACSPQSPEAFSGKSQPVNKSNISRLDIVDKQGNHYGIIQMTALGDAIIYNNEGEIIGNVTAVTQNMASAQ